MSEEDNETVTTMANNVSVVEAMPMVSISHFFENI